MGVDAAYFASESFTAASASPVQRPTLLHRIAVVSPTDQPAGSEVIEDEPCEIVLFAEGNQRHAFHRVEQKDIDAFNSPANASSNLEAAVSFVPLAFVR